MNDSIRGEGAISAQNNVDVFNSRRYAACDALATVIVVFFILVGLRWFGVYSPVTSSFGDALVVGLGNFLGFRFVQKNHKCRPVLNSVKKVLIAIIVLTVAELVNNATGQTLPVEYGRPILLYILLAGLGHTIGAMGAKKDCDKLVWRLNYHLGHFDLLRR